MKKYERSGWKAYCEGTLLMESFYKNIGMSRDKIIDEIIGICICVLR
jgi:hypothetical protein